MSRFARIMVHSVQGNGFRWPVVLHSHNGQACPDCGPVVIGDNHRAAHKGFHRQLETLQEQVVILSRAVRELAQEAGHGDWYVAGEGAPLDGYVVGSGELPPETRGGDD